MECEFCKKVLSTKMILKTHQKTAKYCQEIQENNGSDKIENVSFKCDYCGAYFTSKSSYNYHISNACKQKKKIDMIKENQIIIKDHEKTITKLESEYEKTITKLESEYEKTITKLESEYEKTITKLKTEINIYKELAIQANSCISNIALNNTRFDIETEPPIIEENIDEEYKLTPLELQDGFIVEHRDIDRYINITNLCKAGGKKFNDWRNLEETKQFLSALKDSTDIPVNKLLQYEDIFSSNHHIWVHPQIAVNIAQWISPLFDVKVTAWVNEIMITGKVDISNTKSYRDLKRENKNKNIRIKFLEKKYIKKQHRTQYIEKNVIYIVTTARLKKDRIYVLGKAIDLTSRLSVYNKSDEHEVIFYHPCPDEDTMSAAEIMIFKKLGKYREQANRERFILPEDENIDIFSSEIKKCINFIL